MMACHARTYLSSVALLRRAQPSKDDIHIDDRDGNSNVTGTTFGTGLASMPEVTRSHPRKDGVRIHDGAAHNNVASAAGGTGGPYVDAGDELG
jgi:hypothetical protein